jgi:hypothetical protein
MTGKHNTPRDLSALGGDPSRRESDTRAGEDQYRAAINGLVGTASQDELEGMMAAQIFAAHGAAMDCYRSAAEAHSATTSRSPTSSRARSRCSSPRSVAAARPGPSSASARGI